MIVLKRARHFSTKDWTWAQSCISTSIATVWEAEATIGKAGRRADQGGPRRDGADKSGEAAAEQPGG
jgi:hypothetical protein